MNTQMEKKRMYKEAKTLLLRAQRLLDAAYNKHRDKRGDRKAA